MVATTLDMIALVGESNDAWGENEKQLDRTADDIRTGAMAVCGWLLKEMRDDLSSNVLDKIRQVEREVDNGYPYK